MSVGIIKNEIELSFRSLDFDLTVEEATGPKKARQSNPMRVGLFVPIPKRDLSSIERYDCCRRRRRRRRKDHLRCIDDDPLARDHIGRTL